jgi:hypothetical protein
MRGDEECAVESDEYSTMEMCQTHDAAQEKKKKKK